MTSSIFRFYLKTHILLCSFINSLFVFNAKENTSTTTTTIMNCLLGARICFPSLFSFFFFIFIVLSIGGGLRLPSHHNYISVSFHEKSASAGHQPHVHHKEKERAMGEEVGMEMYPTGSSLPDCSHACGPCFPCKRVMVSFKCSTAESCPIVYRCMCKGKYYHVPSN